LVGSTQRFQLSRVRALFAWVAVLLFLCPGLSAQVPRLTIWIVADQFRADYLQHYESDFGTRGLCRMQAEGASFRRIRFHYGATFTAPGAATLATGAYPETHGIVANSWYDKQSGQMVHAVGSKQLPTLVALNGSTLADELNLATAGQSRIVAIADDPRLAVLLAGHRPSACLWRGTEGELRSSTYYTPMPEWAAEFAAANPIATESRREWRAVGVADGVPPLRVLAGDRYLDYYLASPFAVEDVFGLARSAIEHEHLGRDSVPDLLILGLGAPGLLGLETGAYSPLMRDLAVRLDAEIASLLAWLEDAELLEETAIVFTAAHGIPPQKTDIARANLPGGSVVGDRLAQGINLALEIFPRVQVEKYVFPFVSFNAAFGAMPAETRERVVRTAGAAALEFPGVEAYYAPEASSAVGGNYRRLERGFYAGRSGDLVLSYAPFYAEHYGDGRGTSSGSPHVYDTDVPLLLFGRWFRPGISDNVADAASLAPTLARLLGTAQPSGAHGQVLTEALRLTDPARIGPPLPASR
jgi:hypothetical protein